MPESTTVENSLSKRLNKVLETKIENDHETLEALAELSTFYTGNTLQARRNLRSQIERHSLEINENFFKEFKNVKNAFDNIYHDIEKMSESLQNMIVRLQNAKKQTKHLLDQTNACNSELNQNNLEKKVTQSVIQAFVLTKDELVALHGNQKRMDVITPTVFTTLDHVQKIHNDCKVLLQSGYQTLALDIMEQMTFHQEASLERLYRWLQDHCRNLENAELMDFITQIMSRLEDRSVLFKYALDDYCMSRKSILVTAFIDALTRGGPSGNPAPIEMRAHDAQVYVTDILIWLNKAIPIEHNNLLSLVKLCKKKDLKEQLVDSLCTICEGICHPLKLRIEKVLTTTTQVSTLYAITNVVRYYRKSIEKVCSKGLLQTTLTELQNKFEEVYITTLQDYVKSTLIRLETPPRDLSPTSAINHLIAILKDMLSTANMSEGREVDMIKIVNSVMEPVLRAINEQASRLPPTDMAVYMLNCMYCMYSCLSLYEFMEDRLERLQAQTDAQLDTLTSELASSLVANLNLGPIYTILQDHSHGPLSNIPGLEPSNLRNFLIRLKSLIKSSDTTLLPQINLLISSKHKKIVQKRAFDVILAIYKQLYEGVLDTNSLYENPESILDTHPDELTKMLLEDKY